MTGDPPASTAATVTSSSSDTKYDPYLGEMEERRRAKKDRRRRER